jgi:hypothetical protein
MAGELLQEALGSLAPLGAGATTLAALAHLIVERRA